MKVNEKWWLWVIVIIIAILTPIMNHYFKYSYFLSTIILIIALNSTKELRQEIKINFLVKYKIFIIIYLAIIFVYLLLENFVFNE
ncbi:hypothetical protein AM500_18980 [Bacillus sp. FJAT-18017]|nr:hypothetical protein AM500_18980 [Bacillus sp. FJAT-18017]